METSDDYVVIKRFDSLRKITDYMFLETCKLSHLGISLMLHHSMSRI